MKKISDDMLFQVVVDGRQLPVIFETLLSATWYIRSQIIDEAADIRRCSVIDQASGEPVWSAGKSVLKRWKKVSIRRALKKAKSAYILSVLEHY